MRKAVRRARRIYLRGVRPARRLLLGLRSRRLPGGLVLVRTAEGMRPARVREDACPLQAMRENLDLGVRGAGARRACRTSASGRSPGSRPPWACPRCTGPGRSPRSPRPPGPRPATPGRCTSAPTRRGRPGCCAARCRSCAPRTAVRVAGYFVSPSGTLVLGPEYGCDLEFWPSEGPNLLVAPRPNRDHAHAARGRRRRWRARGAVQPAASPRRGAARGGTAPGASSPCGTWTTSTSRSTPSTPGWTAPTRRGGPGGTRRSPRRARLTDAAAGRRPGTPAGTSCATRCARWTCTRRGSGTMWIVTDGQVPGLARHRSPEGHRRRPQGDLHRPGVLPMFNSHAIETQLHHIDGLERALPLLQRRLLPRPPAAAETRSSRRTASPGSSPRRRQVAVRLAGAPRSRRCTRPA